MLLLLLLQMTVNMGDDVSFLLLGACILATVSYAGKPCK